MICDDVIKDGARLITRKPLPKLLVRVKASKIATMSSCLQGNGKENENGKRIKI